MIKLLIKTFTALFTFFALFIFNADAQNVTVAIAANLQPVMKDLQRDFKIRSQIDLDIISGSSGNLATQIRNGAPYDVFLSADTEFPEALQKDGFTIKNAAVYAQGVLIICSTQNLHLKNWNQLLPLNNINKIAIGNPAIAPYGKAAQQALNKAGIYNKVKNKIVFGESIAQVNTYITTGVVQAGFTTLSLIKDVSNKTPLYYQIISANHYQPIAQAMVVLKNAKNKSAAIAFYQYLLSAPAKKIFKAYGYHTL
ncbi:molybdate ABC transporter substrate-binding protein [Mucilaginibacter phyllosphaerae]|uniref:Molybdate ABC transporter substrate-binding protein n=1 Tax=Mucilaginibacter phyllosphaerae TaxID=1812349 RepID=A0A4Y8AET0_9SPHI|nr:molybdate ABC transporter substrate-binding protein [Mucilaginibacter phyllosphaerae]MBB3970300.1 molybdate transport system substrate-binding protein [Mucilaginibacter phyllosphaerae]TEW66672.1 molybdate ABC transporter substrate-binding protein [Mucilaginibacter phyllosphaerae]GGH11148.1 molybdate ABC transporter substrate-binding protein [Mucilaginibacter phyllosphaerae]